MRRGDMSPDDLDRPVGNSLEEKPYEDRDWLREKYVSEKMTQSEIADVANCSQHTISRWLREHGIGTRKSKDYIIHPTVRMNDKGYYICRCQSGDSDDRFYLHRLVAVSKYGFEAVSNKDVHHKSKCTWDNRVENIEVMDSGEHYSHHRKEEQSRGEKLEERFN
jgi:hypothetical protein